MFWCPSKLAIPMTKKQSIIYIYIYIIYIYILYIYYIYIRHRHRSSKISLERSPFMVVLIFWECLKTFFGDPLCWNISIRTLSQLISLGFLAIYFYSKVCFRCTSRIIQIWFIKFKDNHLAFTISCCGGWHEVFPPGLS